MQTLCKAMYNLILPEYQVCERCCCRCLIMLLACRNSSGPRQTNTTHSTLNCRIVDMCWASCMFSEAVPRVGCEGRIFGMVCCMCVTIFKPQKPVPSLGVQQQHCGGKPEVSALALCWWGVQGQDLGWLFSSNYFCLSLQHELNLLNQITVDTVAGWHNPLNTKQTPHSPSSSSGSLHNRWQFRCVFSWQHNNLGSDYPLRLVQVVYLRPAQECRCSLQVQQEVVQWGKSIPRAYADLAIFFHPHLHVWGRALHLILTYSLLRCVILVYESNNGRAVNILLW